MPSYLKRTHRVNETEDSEVEEVEAAYVCPKY